MAASQDLPQCKNPIPDYKKNHHWLELFMVNNYAENHSTYNLETKSQNVEWVGPNLLKQTK